MAKIILTQAPVIGEQRYGYPVGKPIEVSKDLEKLFIDEGIAKIYVEEVADSEESESPEPMTLEKKKKK